MFRLATFKPLAGLIHHGKVTSVKFNVRPFLNQKRKQLFSSTASVKQTSDETASLLEELDRVLEKRASPDSGEQASFNARFNRSERPDRSERNVDYERSDRPQRSYERSSERRDRGDRNFDRPRSSSSRDEFPEEKFEVAEISNFDYTKYEKVSVDIKGDRADSAQPIDSFQDMNLHPSLLANIRRRNFKEPVIMQKYTIPLAMENRDLMMCAQTGSGKTAAFIFPIISKLLKEGKGRYPHALIMAPTRELAQQIHAETIEFTKGTDIKPVVVFGGSSVFMQANAVRSGANIVIGTPGRLQDLVERGSLNLKQIKTLVLDEADRMLDMGFEVQIRKLLSDSDMPKSGDRQTMLFSATFPREIQRLAADYMGKYTYLSFGRIGSATETVQQSFVYANTLREKNKKVVDLILSHAKEGEGGALVFFEQKRLVDEYEWLLKNEHQLEVMGIHGDKSQNERNYTLKAFSNGKTKVLLATSVASRGLDLKNITHVINVGLPRDMDDYIHRVGRTGRAGKIGKATTVVSEDDAPSAQRLAEILRESKLPIPNWLDDLMASSRRGGNQRKSFKSPSEFRGNRFGDRSGDRYGDRGGDRFGDRRHSSSFDRRSSFGDSRSSNFGERRGGDRSRRNDDDGDFFEKGKDRKGAIDRLIDNL